MLDAHGHISLSSPPFTDPLVLMEEIFVSYPTQKHLSIVTTNSKLEHLRILRSDNTFAGYWETVVDYMENKTWENVTKEFP